MAVYTRLLGGPLLLSPGGQTLFTVPAATVYVVRNIGIVVQGGATNPTIQIVMTSFIAANLLWREILPFDTTRQWETRWVFTAGQLLRAASTLLPAGQTATINAQGYVFDA